VFLGLPGNIDGLVHLSDLHWTLPGEQAIRDYKKGQDVEAVVLAIDVEKERISLGVKQLDGDPFNNYTAMFDKGAIVKAVVKATEARGVTVTLADDVEAYLRASEISRDRVEDASTRFKEGEELEVMIINVDRKTRSINVSIKAKDNAEESDAISKHSNEGSAGTTNLGALLKAKMKGAEK
jgi:small subunit ribosomal protein S1